MTQDEKPGEVLDRLGMDGVKWATEFRNTALQLGYSDMDEGWLIGWFCNAIMSGYDRAPRADLAQAPAPVRVKPDVDAIESGGKRWHGEDHRVVSVRWEPYKPDGARQMKAKGRWQEQVGSGDYWRWQNCERPQFLAALEPDAGVAELVEAAKAFNGPVLDDPKKMIRAVDRLRAVLAKLGVR